MNLSKELNKSDGFDQLYITLNIFDLHITVSQSDDFNQHTAANQTGLINMIANNITTNQMALINIKVNQILLINIATNHMVLINVTGNQMAFFI